MEKVEEILKQILGVLGEIKILLEDVEWIYDDEDEEEEGEEEAPAPA